MKRFDIDARNLDCPKPLLRTKKALSDESFDILTVQVDNIPARENVCRFLSHSGYSPEWNETDGIYTISVQKEGNERVSPTETRSTPERKHPRKQGKNVLITDTRIGSEEEELGRLLMKGYLYTLTQLEELPRTVIFMNSGVRLCLEGSENLDDLKALEKKSVEILVCGTCLEFLNVREQLAAGRISNMYEISSKIHGSEELVKIT